MGTMRKKEGHLFIVSESANWYSHLRDSVGKYPKNIKINLPQDSAIYTTVIQKDSTHTLEKLAYSYSLLLYS